VQARDAGATNDAALAEELARLQLAAPRDESNTLP